MKADLPINVAAGVLIYKGKVLMAKRHGGYLDNLWEFPGGKLEKDETPQAAIKRELKEELDIDIIPEKLILNPFAIPIVVGTWNPNANAADTGCLSAWNAFLLLSAFLSVSLWFFLFGLLIIAIGAIAPVPTAATIAFVISLGSFI